MRRWLAAVALVAATVVSAAATVWAQSTTGPPAVEIHKVDEGHFVPTPGGPYFMLVVGIDGRPGLGGNRGDALHVIGVNPAQHAATIINIPRDSFVAIPGHGQDKINAAFDFGGPQLEADTVAALVGVHPTFVLVTGFVGFQAMVNDIGGVDVDVPMAMNDHFSGANFPAGRVHMDGQHALAFSRNRHLGQGDLTRTQDQSILLIDTLRQLRANGANSALGTVRVLGTLVRHTQVTGGVGVLDLYHLGRLALSTDPGRVRNVTMPARLGQVGGASVVFVGAGAGDLFADFRDDAILETH